MKCYPPVLMAECIKKTNKKNIMSTFKIDFCELAILSENCIPPTSIARHCFFEKISNEYYAQMSKNERERFFEMIRPKLDLKNKDCQHFYARFNSKNQYRIKTTYNGDTKEQDVYLFDGEYHISKYMSINENYIDSVTPLFSKD